MNRPLRLLAALAPIFVAATAHATDRPNLNAYALAPSLGIVRTPLPGARVASTDRLTGAPTMLFASGAGSKATPSMTTEAAGRKHLLAYAGHYGVPASAVANAELHHVHDLGHGGIIATYRQRVGGVEVFRHDVKVMMDRSKDLIAIGGNLHPAGGAVPRGARFSLGEAGAIAVAFNDLFGKSVTGADFHDNGDRNGDYLHFDLSARGAKASNHELERAARVKKVWFALPDRLVPAYFLEIIGGTSKSSELDSYAYVIGADDGRLLYRENLTHYDTFNYRVWADTTGDLRCTDGPLVDYTPYAGAPDNGSYPAFNPTPPLIAMDTFKKDPPGQSDPWLPTGATVTTGNNVDAFTAPEGATGFQAGDIRATTTAANTFDRVYDLTAGPQSSSDQQMASVTQLFYQTNWMHDYWYDSGFTEAAGNAQTDNFGRGGVAGDVLQAHAQAGAPQSRNNSNMNVPADGSSPIMQMYVWDGMPDRTLTLNGTQFVNGPADFGPTTFDVTANLVLVNDNTAPDVNDACESIVNVIAGQIAVIDRGTCSFQSKAVMAQNSGAVGVIIIDNKTESPIDMAGDNTQPPVTIPVLSMTLADGTTLKTNLGTGVVLGTMHEVGSVDRDGTIDNTVSGHEWGHYLHLRQVSCNNPQCLGQSEGWADFNALLMIFHPGDDHKGIYPMAVYATAAFPTDPGYFGIRRYPYSSDLNVNPLTFKYIEQGSGLPPGPPVSDMGDPNNEVHSVGEIWASMLFQSYVALLDRATGSNPPYTETQAHRRMADYVVGGMQLAPVDPTITEQRDAVLAAAAANDKDDFVAMAKAFAKRGAGTCAVSPDRESTDLSGVMEDFTVSPNASIVSVALDDKGKSCDKDGYVDIGEGGRVVVVVTNDGAAALSGAKVKVSTTSADVKFPSGATVSLPDLQPFDTINAIVDISLADDTKGPLSFNVTAELDADQACNKTASSTIAAHAAANEKPMSSATDDVEAKTSTWKAKGDNADLIWSVVTSGAGNHAWSGIDFSSPSDTNLESPSLDVGSAKNFVMSFDHKYDFEQSMGTNWDGSVIEISIDNGATWQDISMYGDPGYGGSIGDPQANNPLLGRTGYVGKNMSNPMTDHVSIDMGKALAGKSVKVRFRIGTDDAQGEPGWIIDNIAFAGITNTPFTSLVADDSVCMTGTGGGGAGGAAEGGGGPAATGAGGAGGGAGGKGPESGGCGCELPGRANDSTTPSLALVAALAAIAGRRRRRRA